jgi:curli biogenesis system outer membrane secretion channel CsgG
MLRPLTILLLVLLAFVAPAARADTTFVEIQAIGKAGTAEAAVRSAVLDALRRVNVSKVSAQPGMQQRFDSALADLDRALSAPGVSVTRMEAEARTLSAGLVDRLKVLDQRKSADGATVDVTVLTAVALFDAKAASAGKKTIAVVPFRSSSATYMFGASEIPAAEIARRLADRTTQALVQANVVTVLDRDFVDATVKERQFVEAYGKTPEELARFGRMLGADYLLVGSIENGGMVVNTQTVEASGYTFSQAFAGLSTSVRLLDVASGAIRWADSVTSSMSNGELNGGAINPIEVVDRVTADVAADTTQGIVDSIAPIKVALVDGDAIWLNRGAGRLEAGQRLAIRGGGVDVIDPDTGENLGQAERTVAVVQVISTDQKKSQCRLLEGDPNAVKVGQLARLLWVP